MKEEWCGSREYVENDKITRCSKCGRRLKPQETWSMDVNENNSIIHTPTYRLPPHKVKGYKIQRKKGHNKRHEKRIRK